MSDSSTIFSSVQRHNLPVELAVTITKGYPRLNVPCRKQSPLKEYSAGDTIIGIVMVTNHSLEPIPFDRLMVSLEGFVSTGKERKLILKSCGDDDVNDTDEAQELDRVRDAWCGFGPDRVLLPNKTYEKFFELEVPANLPIENCCHNNPEHLRLPPSLGIEQIPTDGDPVMIDPVLGYAKISGWGGAVKVPDYALKDTYVSYSVTIQLIGTKDYDSGILQEFRHFIRIRTHSHSLSTQSTRTQLEALHATPSYSVVPKRRILENAADYLQESYSSVSPWYSEEGAVRLYRVLHSANVLGVAVSIPCGSAINAIRQYKFSADDLSEISTLVSTKSIERNPYVHVSARFGDANDKDAQPSKPPSKLSFKAHLRVINMVSSGLPVSLDDEFIWRAQMQFTGTKFEHSTIKDFFEPSTLKMVWTYDRMYNSYVASFDMPLKVNCKALKNKHYICPGFQTCNIGRWYQVEVEVGTKKMDWDNGASLAGAVSIERSSLQHSANLAHCTNIVNILERLCWLYNEKKNTTEYGR